MKKEMTVNAFVKAKVQPPLRPVVNLLRALMRKYAPEAQEYMNHGLLTYKGRKILAVLTPAPEEITFSFSHGADFADLYGLLQGSGKLARSVKLKSLGGANQIALRYYIKQALKHDAQ